MNSLMSKMKTFKPCSNDLTPSKMSYHHQGEINYDHVHNIFRNLSK